MRPIHSDSHLLELIRISTQSERNVDRAAQKRFHAAVKRVFGVASLQVCTHCGCGGLVIVYVSIVHAVVKRVFGVASLQVCTHCGCGGLVIVYVSISTCCRRSSVASGCGVWCGLVIVCVSIAYMLRV